MVDRGGASRALGLTGLAVLALKLHVLAVGRMSTGPEALLVERYAGRIAGPLAITELSQPRFPPAAAGTRTMALDETGDDIDSQELARRIATCRADGVRELRFLIGGADGLGDLRRLQPDWIIRFGRMTWPHLMVRAMLLEQLYRAQTILSNHPYHRA